jgi:hypothetical protein
VPNSDAGASEQLEAGEVAGELADVADDYDPRRAAHSLGASED